MDTPPPQPITPGSKWPKTLGIITIVFGAFALLQALISPLSQKAAIFQFERLAEVAEDPTEIDLFIGEFVNATRFTPYLLGGVALLLLIGGILLIKRNRVARPILSIWAVLKIAVGCYTTVVMHPISQKQYELMLSTDEYMGTSAAQPFDVQAFLKVLSTIGTVFGVLWLIALPIFLLIWFNRKKIKAEIAQWA